MAHEGRQDEHRHHPSHEPTHAPSHDCECHCREWRFVATTLGRLLELVEVTHMDIHARFHALQQRLDTMDANIQAAFDRQNVTLTQLTDSITMEIAEIQALVAAIPGAGDPTEVVAAVDAATSRLDTLAESIRGVSDAVFPPATPPV